MRLDGLCHDCGEDALTELPPPLLRDDGCAAMVHVDRRSVDRKDGVIELRLGAEDRKVSGERHRGVGSCGLELQDRDADQRRFESLARDPEAAPHAVHQEVADHKMSSPRVALERRWVPVSPPVRSCNRSVDGVQREESCQEHRRNQPRRHPDDRDRRQIGPPPRSGGQHQHRCQGARGGLGNSRCWCRAARRGSRSRARATRRAPSGSGGSPEGCSVRPRSPSLRRQWRPCLPRQDAARQARPPADAAALDSPPPAPGRRDL